MLMPRFLTAQKQSKLRTAKRLRYLPVFHISDASSSITKQTRSAMIFRLYPLGINMFFGSIIFNEAGS